MNKFGVVSWDTVTCEFKLCKDETNWIKIYCTVEIQLNLSVIVVQAWRIIEITDRVIIVIRSLISAELQ